MKELRSGLLAASIIIALVSLPVTSTFPVAAVRVSRETFSTAPGVRLHDTRSESSDADITRRRRHRNFEHWGLETFDLSYFPSSFEDVADDVFDAIAGTVSGRQRPDPQIVSNAMSQSVLDYRPTHPLASSKQTWSKELDFNAKSKKFSKKEMDVPLRMGVEIDGAAYLSNQAHDEGRAMRILALHIAKRLSTSSWEKNDPTSSRRIRSVAIYFNSVEQSLLASRELRRWKKDHEMNTGCTSFDDIHVYCLGQDSLPFKGKIQHQQSTILEGGDAGNPEPKESIILIVKPTDHDVTNSRGKNHPTIQANVVDKLQTLLFQAAASCIPAVVLSPRLSELPPLQQQSSFQVYKRTGPSGFEQSGYQISSTYGGVEPPVGPTSWLLRDLVPPIYVWVGSAYNVQQRENLRWRSVVMSHREQEYNTEKMKDGISRLGEFHHESMYSFYSRVALRQSAMDPGHSWHMFAVKERLNLLPKVNQVEKDVSYHYIGSTIAARGRPSSRIMNDVFEEFIEHSASI